MRICPPDILEHIIRSSSSLVRPDALASLERVNRHWRDVIWSSDLWFEAFARVFGSAMLYTSYSGVPEIKRVTFTQRTAHLWDTDDTGNANVATTLSFCVKSMLFASVSSPPMWRPCVEHAKSVRATVGDFIFIFFPPFFRSRSIHSRWTACIACCLLSGRSSAQSSCSWPSPASVHCSSSRANTPSAGMSPCTISSFR